MKVKLSLKNRLSSLSLRRQILLTSLISFMVMVIVLFSTMRVSVRSVEVLGNSYRSNIDLSSFSKSLESTEKAMESYVNYHTFDSIDSFYAHRNNIENYISGMQNSPSVSDLKQKEYIVKQLTRTFIAYSSKAVYARRGNNNAELDYYYAKTINCYNLLISELLELNKQLLESNTYAYQQNHKRSTFSIEISFILFLSLAALIFIVLYFTITAVTKPLSDISDVAIRVSKRDFDVPLFNNEQNNEIGTISRAFDRMIVSIREYIDTIWEKARTEAELKEKEIEMQALYTDAQLRALQNQINPHFLFNTLNTGVQLSMMEGADKTCFFLEQVADFFRYNIQNQKETATIDEELGIIDNFVYIMKVRFGNRLVFTKKIPEESFTELIPVMTLQPLVENCIKYSLKNEQGLVELKVEPTEEYVIISVSDNGCGISPEIKKSVIDAVKNDITKLPQELLKKQDTKSGNMEKHNGMGLINVFLRLKMYFSRDDIFEITENEDGTGTRFIIRIPKNV
ncbi:MAG: histidine kinase [Treponema sp.]|nr:histidine kinase [Treponema sp.]